jgi:hypothetical protein
MKGKFVTPKQSYPVGTSTINVPFQKNWRP